jgi:hypothetical protein
VKISEIVEKTGLEALNAWEDGDIPAVYVSDMASDIITGAQSGCLLLTLQTHKNLIAAANVVDAGMIVFAHGKRPADDVLDLAGRVRIALFCTPDDTWTYARRLFDLGMR